MSKWEFYKNEYMVLTFVFVIGGVLAAFTAENAGIWLSPLLIVIGVIVIPFASYLSWKKKNF